MIVMDEFLWRALLAGIGIALVSGPMGCFVVWRRMAYFGDAMAHAALLGVAAGLFFGLHPTLGVFAAAFISALALLFLRRRVALPLDTLLGAISHAALALGLVVLSLMWWVRADLLALLFGDILAVSWRDVALIYGGGAVIMAVLIVIWRPLLATAVSEDIALAEAKNVMRAQMVFMILMAAIIALAIAIVGVLLITALLIIPAAAARRFAATPEGMAMLASAMGCFSVVVGLFGSVVLDTPAGPSIILAALFLFVGGAVGLTSSR